MANTPDRFPGSREEEELILIDDASGDPITAGGVKYDANKFRLKDNSAVFGPDDVRVSANDTTPGKLINKLTGDGLTFSEVNDGNNEQIKATMDTTSPGPYLFDINPSSLLRSGSSGAVSTEGFAANEFAKNNTSYGEYSLRWRRDPATTVKLYVTFALKADAGGSDVVRIVARTKPVAVGENISVVSFSAAASQDVSVASGVAGVTYAAVLVLTPAEYQQGDQVAINIGRDGSHANDNYNKSVFVLTIQGEVD